MGYSTIRPKATIPRLILSEPDDAFFCGTDDIIIYDRFTFDEVVRVHRQESETATRNLAQQIADHLNGPED